MIINRSAFVLLALAAAMALSGCNAVNEQMAYRDHQRRDCTAAGGYFEDNKIGAPDNYTCKGLPGSPTAAAAHRRPIAAPKPPRSNTTMGRWKPRPTKSARRSDPRETPRRYSPRRAAAAHSSAAFVSAGANWRMVTGEALKLLSVAPSICSGSMTTASLTRDL